MTTSKALPAGTVAAYGLPMLAYGYTGGLVGFYFLKFSTDVLLLAPATIGLIFGLSRLWDAFFDLPVGHLSDRTRTRFGRRRPWLLASVIPSGLLFVAMWSPPAALGGVEMMVWTAVAVVLFHSAQTIFAVPHFALASELSDDPHERTRLFAARLGCDTGGIFLSLAALYALENAEAPRAMAATLCWWGAIAGGVLVAWCALAQAERPAAPAPARENLRDAYLEVWRDVPARRLLTAAFIELLGVSSLGTLLPYLSQYVLRTPGYTSYYLLCFFLPFLLSIPFWPRLSRRFGKRAAWIGATVVKAAGFGACFFVGAGDWLQIVVIVAVVGIADGGARTIGPSLYSDAIVEAAERGGRRRDGAYFGAWNLAVKAATAVSVAIVGVLLQLGDFQPNVEQAPETELMLRILASVLPMIFCLIAAAIVAEAKTIYLSVGSNCGPVNPPAAS